MPAKKVARNPNRPLPKQRNPLLSPAESPDRELDSSSEVAMRHTYR